MRLRGSGEHLEKGRYQVCRFLCQHLHHISEPLIDKEVTFDTKRPVLSVFFMVAIITFEVPDLLATDRLGRLLAEYLPDSSVVALIGTLGAGKTKLVQAIAKYTGNAEEIISSPTFVLLHEYDDGKRPIYHFDAYRLETAEEFCRLSPDDYFEGTGLTLIEWADKFPQILPANYLEIRIEPLGETQRRFHLSGHGTEYDMVISKIAQAIPTTINS